MSKRLWILAALLIAALAVSGCCCCYGGSRTYGPQSPTARPVVTICPTLLPATTDVTVAPVAKVEARVTPLISVTPCPAAR